MSACSAVDVLDFFAKTRWTARLRVVGAQLEKPAGSTLAPAPTSPGAPIPATDGNPTSQEEPRTARRDFAGTPLSPTLSLKATELTESVIPRDDPAELGS